MSLHEVCSGIFILQSEYFASDLGGSWKLLAFILNLDLCTGHNNPQNDLLIFDTCFLGNQVLYRSFDTFNNNVKLFQGSTETNINPLVQGKVDIFALKIDVHYTYMRTSHHLWLHSIFVYLCVY